MPSATTGAGRRRLPQHPPATGIACRQRGQNHKKRQQKVAPRPKRWLDGQMNGSLGEVAGTAPVTVLDVHPPARPLPAAVRASLDAVRAAQLAARRRARRETWQARALVAGVAAAVTVGGMVLWPHIHGRKNAKPPVVAPVAVPAPPPPVTAPPEAVPAAAAEALGTCHDSYQSKRWRAAAAACATAFAAHPDDAKLALRVAEAEYARDHLSEARQRAQRTLALDTTQADALAIIGRSEQRTGHAEAAASAFRRYLQLAPRGWHAAEARAVVRREHAHARRAVAQSRGRDEDAAPNPEAPAPAPAPHAAPAPEPRGRHRRRRR